MRRILRRLRINEYNFVELIQSKTLTSVYFKTFFCNFLITRVSDEEKHEGKSVEYKSGAIVGSSAFTELTLGIGEVALLGTDVH